MACGGKSSRMGQDKSLLVYHELPQRYHLYNVLQPLCREVIFSCNNNQVNDFPKVYTTIPDKEGYQDKGPMGGLLSAYACYPGNDFIFIGCDYPDLVQEDIYSLVQQNGDQPAAYYDPEAGFYEPLLAYYPASCHSPLKEQSESGNYSLQQFLQSWPAKKIVTSGTQRLQSIDTFTGYNDFIQNRIK